METELRLVVGVQTDVVVLCWTLNVLKLLLLEGYRSLPSLSCSWLSAADWIFF